ncbi:MAG: hypothetical protein KJI70_03395 [Patescibacteria group bacterium]|nr:hypothetical protein [Patescibacteria group bacterium]
MLQNYLDKKEFYRFTGPPENWITAIKYMTWGLEKKHFSTWKNIVPGDIFLMHSMSTGTRLRGVKSAIIGFGVVGDELKKEKTEYLWIQEKEKRVNKWPLLVPFSEIYLFSEFDSPQSLPDVEINNLELINKLAVRLLFKAIPLKAVQGFPVMGSFSRVKPDIVKKILDYSAELFSIQSSQAESLIYIPSNLLKFEKSEDIFRYGTSLMFLEDVSKRVINRRKSMIIRDNTLLERANNAHQDTLEKIRIFFKNKDYEVYFNKHIDLFATNFKQSYLFEVKSYENKNFIAQARNGIAKLFEYEYFEVKKFYNDNKLPELKTFKSLAFSKKPKNIDYVNFINSLNLGVTFFEKDKLSAVGKVIGINKI